MRHLAVLVLVAAITSACASQQGACPDPATPKKYGATTNDFGNPYGKATAVYGVDGSLATGAVAGAGTYRSDWIDLQKYVGGFSFDVAWAGGSGTPAGTLGVEVSNADVPPNLSTAAVALPLANTPTAISGNSGTSGVDAPLTGFRYARLVATVSAGTFTLTALAYGKRIN